MTPGTTSHRFERLWSRAEAYLAQRNLEAARAAYEAALAVQPDFAFAFLRLSTVATQQRRYRDAVAPLVQLAAQRPADPALRVLLAGLLHRFGEARPALDCLSPSAFAAVRDSGLLLEAANLASQLEDLPSAEALLAFATNAGNARSPPLLYQRGTLHVFAGRLDQAEADFEAAIASAPNSGQAHWALSRVRRQTADANHVARLRKARAAAASDADAALIGFALFKELDDLGRYDEAWVALADACVLKRRSLDYRPDADSAAFARLMTVCDRTYLAAPASPTDADGPVPIFIVGLPRSGTTLLERMFGRHPEVHIGGELDDFPLQLRWCADRFSKSFLDADLFAAAATVDPAEWGRRYREHIRWRAGGKRWITDKLPLNFLNVGFIHRALPEARVVHLVRHPLDACLSNLKELFADAYAYSYDFDELATYYGHYRRLMAHWHTHLPGKLLDVSYEALARDPAAVGAAVFAHCGLDWAPEYVHTERGSTAVTTASSVQVRQAIHTGAIGQSRNYRAALAPLAERLRRDGWLPAGEA